jgi:hypothetical protein
MRTTGCLAQTVSFMGRQVLDLLAAPIEWDGLLPDLQTSLLALS